MLAAIALIPSAPVLVPDLAGAAAAEIAEFTAAARAAAGTLPDRWVVIGVGHVAQLIEPATRGTFAGYGVDLPVTLAPQAPPQITSLPLCALIAGWLRDQVNPGARVEVRVYPHDLDATAAMACGRELINDIGTAAAPIGVLVVADGAHTLTASAPGGYEPGSVVVQQVLDDALAIGDTEALMRVPAGILGRVAYQVLAGLAPRPGAAEELIRGAPLGVGYFIGTWRPDPDPL